MVERHVLPVAVARARLRCASECGAGAITSSGIVPVIATWRNQERDGLLDPKPGATLDGCGWLRHARGCLRKRRKSVTNLPRRRSTCA